MTMHPFDFILVLIFTACLKVVNVIYNMNIVTTLLQNHMFSTTRSILCF